MKAFADNHKKVTKKLKFLLGWGEIILGKRRKCWLPAFSVFPKMFLKASSSGSLKVGIVWQRVKAYTDNNSNVTQMIEYVSHTVENIVAKEGYAVNLH